ncbi:MAG: spore coat protein U domain-containing protein [Spirochaeta sp.]|nr:spore coat protein U domain-containing protein [Spirochaeta sp.]
MIKKTVLIACALLVVIAGGAFGFGQIEMTAPDAVSEQYSYDGDVVAGRSVSLIVGGGGSGVNRSYSIGFSSGTSGDPENRRLYSSDGTSIPYEILDSVVGGNQLKDLDDGGPVLSGTIPSGGTATESFDVRVFGGAVPSPGIYTDEVTLTAYNFNNATQAQVTLSIAVNVPANISLALSSNNLDLGDLVENATGSVRVTVTSNADYGIELSSPYNNWRMAHEDQTLVSFVPYSLRLDAVTLDLSSNPTLVPGFGSTSSAGREHQLEIIVGSTDDAVSGYHSDVIDITVTANQ